jgi:aryl-alcohol dehydrogenase-like predicted oxidoreductase
MLDVPDKQDDQLAVPYPAVHFSRGQYYTPKGRGVNEYACCKLNTAAAQFLTGATLPTRISPVSKDCWLPPRVLWCTQKIEGYNHFQQPTSNEVIGTLKGLFMISNMQVSKRLLGKTNIEVTPIGLGMMEFAGGGGLMGSAFPKIDQEEKNAAVKAGLDGGINWFDTAELYGSGVSEASLVAALKAAGKADDEVVVATKWWPLFRTARNIPKTIEDRLRFLDGYSISLYMVHQPFGFSSPEAEMDEMAKLVKAGKIRSVGISNFNPEQMRRAHRQLQEHGLPLAVNQVRYSLLDRSIENNGILETAKELGVTIIAYTPLESGLLTGKYHKNPELLEKKSVLWRTRLRKGIEKSRTLVSALEEIAVRYNATTAQAALNWVINSQGDSVVTIPGVTKVSQAQESAGAMKFKLSDDEIARLNELSQAIHIH